MRGSGFLLLAVGGLALGALEGSCVALVVRLPPAASGGDEARAAEEVPTLMPKKVEEGLEEMMRAKYAIPPEAPPGYCSGEDDALDGQAYDYIVVGAGTAGSTAAGRLAEAGKSVLLLERGPDDDWKGVDEFGVINPETPKDWMRMTGQREIDPGPGPTQQAVARAEMVGGCSMLNLMMWMRGAPEIWDMWGGDQWAYDCVLTKFKEMEDSSELPGLDPKYHGHSGPVKLGPFKNYMNTNDFYTWAESRGLEWNGDFNGPSQLGYGPYQMNAYKWTRWSMSRAFLTPTVRAMPNFKLLTLATVTKILFNGTAAVGVQYERTVKRKGLGECRLRGRATAGKEIIISGGAYRSPQLLILSGVGPAETLEKFHIPVVHALEGVGRNLQDHPRLDVFQGDFRTSLSKALAENHTNPVWDVNSTYFGSGAVFASAWCKEHPSVDACRAGADLQFVVSDTGYVLGLVGTPLSRGNVTLVSTDPYQQVAVYNNWMTDGQGGDRARVEELWRMGLDMRGLSQHMPLPEFLPVYDVMVFSFTTLLQNTTLQRLIREGKVAPVYSMWHPAGTCKMGPASDERAVVDFDLRVRGLQNLRVADASVMPYISNTNTNAPSAMVGWTVADLILGRRCARLSRAA